MVEFQRWENEGVRDCSGYTGWLQGSELDAHGCWLQAHSQYATSVFIVAIMMTERSE